MTHRGGAEGRGGRGMEGGDEIYPHQQSSNMISIILVTKGHPNILSSYRSPEGTGIVLYPLTRWHQRYEFVSVHQGAPQIRFGIRTPGGATCRILCQISRGRHRYDFVSPGGSTGVVKCQITRGRRTTGMILCHQVAPQVWFSARSPGGAAPQV